MIPSKSNMTSPCTPVSSNCVIWQGPDISCIDLCKGDTVSDVVAALAVHLCEIIESTCTWCEPDLSALDLKCVLPVEPLPAPADLEETLQAIIDYLCEVAIKEITIPNIALPACLQYRGDNLRLVTELPIAEWAVLIGNKICDILFDINIINQNIINLESRIVVLENCVLPCIPSADPDFPVVSSCLFPSTSTPISVLLLALETAFCNLRSATGTVGQINIAISAQCLSSTSPSLAAGGVSTLGNITGWVDTPATLAESNVNQWLAICDIYAAVADIQINCCDTGCAGVIFGFTYTTIDGNGDGLVDQLNLNFQGCNIPAGFSDCGGSTTVTITDSNGASVTQNIVVSTLATDPAGANIDITTLNRLASLLIQIDFCVTDTVSQCAESQQLVVPLSIPCPNGAVVSVVGTVPPGISVTFSNVLGTSVSYDIEATSQTTGALLGSTTIANPGTSISYTFTNATAGETYNVQIFVNSGKFQVVCPLQSITIPGTVCNDVETNTPSADPVEALDYYLGLYDNGVIVTRYWYDAADNIIKEENAGATVPCDSPILTSPVMDYLAVSGDVAVNVSYGTEPSPTDFQISWSVDSINWLGLTSYAGAPVNPVVIATGATSGSVYIKVETTCTGPIQSVPSIIRYDFGTTAWTTIQSPAECADTSITAGCPAGIEVARQYLNCGPTTYTIFGGSADSYWFYVGKIVDGTDTRYIYAGWDNATQSVRSVVQCCTCPTFILQDIIQVLCGESGDTVNVTIPYVLGAGEPSMIIVGNPVLGNVVQGAIANEFVYTSAATSDNDYADTFQVQLSPTIQGTGGCSLAQATVQVTNVNCNVKLEHTDQDIYAFIHTQGYTDAEGAQIKQGMTELTDQWTIDFGFSGNIYFIPTDDDRWLGYHKAIVDDGVSWLQSASAAWQALEVLPTTWPGGSGVGVYKNAACVIIFSNESSTDYHPTTLGAGWASQPNPLYKEDFDAYLDMTKGTALSTWGLALNITQPQFPDGLSSILYPLTVDGSGLDDAANILQMLAAYTAQLIPVQKYGIPTAVDITSYMLGGFASSPMPYDGSITPAGETIVNLYKNTARNCGMLALLDQEKTTANITEINDGTNAQFTETLTRAIRSCGDAYPVTTIPTDDRYEVKDCADDETYFVTITDHGCGTIPNGTVVKLQNNGAPFSSGPRSWDALQYKCLIVIDNCSATVVEVTTDLDSTYINCDECPI